MQDFRSRVGVVARSAWSLAVRAGGPRHLVNVAALVGLVLALAGAGPAWSVPLLGLAWVVVVVRGLGALRRALPEAVGPTGTAITARLLVLVGAAVEARPGPAGWTATSVLGLVLLVELALVPLARAAVPLAANLPGLAVRDTPLLHPQLLFVLDTGAMSVVAAALAVRLPGPVVPVVSFVLALPVLLVAVDSAIRVQDRRSGERRLPEILGAYGPTALLHFNAPHGSEHQVAMWLPYLDRLGRPYAVVLRNPTTFRAIRRLTDRPVLLRRYADGLDAVVVPTVKTAFYVNTSPRNEHMLRFLQLNHIQLNHGDSDKAASYRRVFRAYDKNFVAGRAAVDRFAQHGIKVPADAFEIVGRPQVEAVAVRPGLPPLSFARSVLYAPTWNGYHEDSRYSSLPIGTRVVSALLQRGCTVVFRPHPWCRRDRVLAREVDAVTALLQSDAASSGRRHLFGADAESARSVADCFNLVDAAVCDVSSVVGDFLYSEKPLCVVDMSEVGTPEDFLKEFPVACGAYVLHARPEPRDLEEVLDDLLVVDPLADRRHAVKQYYLGSAPPEEAARAFLEAARPYV